MFNSCFAVFFYALAWWLTRGSCQSFLLAPWHVYRYALRDPITLCTLACEMRREDTGKPEIDGFYADLATVCEDEAERLHGGIVRKVWALRRKAQAGADAMSLVLELRNEVGEP